MLRFFSIRVREKQKFKNFLNSSEVQKNNSGSVQENSSGSGEVIKQTRLAELFVEVTGRNLVMS